MLEEMVSSFCHLHEMEKFLLNNGERNGQSRISERERVRMESSNTETDDTTICISPYFRDENKPTEPESSIQPMIPDITFLSQPPDGAINRPYTYSLDDRFKHVHTLCKDNQLAGELLKIEMQLSDHLMFLDYGSKVTDIYNPVDYAYRPHSEYYNKYANTTATTVFIGMNPGPFGMAQSGIPFGELESAKNYLKISDQVVGSPRKLNSKRPITGYSTTRREASGSKLWGFVESHFPDPKDFFSKCFIYNHCSLVYMDASGRNITPPQFPAVVLKQMNEACDKAMAKSLSLFPACTRLVGIGRFAEDRIKAICKTYNLPYKQGYMMHPSPRNPTANKNWLQIANEAFYEFGLIDSIPEVVDDSQQNGESSGKTKPTKLAGIKRKLKTD